MIYVFGHKNPDTDSTVSAISLSRLKNLLGMDTQPFLLGKINREAQFVLNYFGIEIPKILEEVNPQVSDLNFDKMETLKIDDSILKAYQMMSEHKSKIMAVSDEEGRLLGLVTMKDIAMGLITGDFYHLKSSLDNIAHAIEGDILVKSNRIIEGEIVIAAYYNETLKERNIFSKETVVIVGDRFDVIEHAIMCQVNLIILTGATTLPDHLLDLALSREVTIISTEKDTYTVGKLINQCNFITKIMNSDKLIKFSKRDYLDEVAEEIAQSAHSNYPVVDRNGSYLGFLGRRHILKPKRKKVILVDHNEYGQSVDGLKEAKILEIVDHHKLGDISTNQPITFTNMPVGSTATIIYNLYCQNRIQPDYETAGLLISGILSDTLYFKSPTTTDIDQRAVAELNEILKLDLDTYVMNMFKAGTSLEGQSAAEIFFKDFKDFESDTQKIGVSQVFTLNFEEIEARKEEILEVLNHTHEANHYTVTLFLVTDIMKNGSYLMYRSEIGNLMNAVFEQNVGQGSFIDNVVSRKKQVIPKIFEELSKTRK